MVLFFCTFLALRAHDCGRPVSDIGDYELVGETELFGGYVYLQILLPPFLLNLAHNHYRQIVDDNFLHALRIFRDKASKAVRLQASVHRGELKR